MSRKSWKPVLLTMVLGLSMAAADTALAMNPDDIIQPQSPVPSIHGARVVGATPGRPFLFLIPATGEKPLAFSASNLPKNLILDPKTGIISGSIEKEGTYSVELTGTGPKGTVKRSLTIIAGQHKLAQTPPMGWNSWNVWGLSVSADKVKAAADAMVSSGLAAHGFSYINIDDGWEKGRDPNSANCRGKSMDSNECGEVGRDASGNIITNEKFPDMKELSGYVHSRGLKLGIYSSPGPWTCGRYTATYQHERQDAEMFARWGIDYLKYDWCSYSEKKLGFSEEYFRKPYEVMRKELDGIDRDIVFSLCQYGMKKVWTWGAEVGGNLWRTTGDITDLWMSLSGIGFKQVNNSPYAGPGHWNDPDMLIVGKVGWGPTLHDTKLSKTEQITHLTMWSMLAAPLLIGCDMTKLDPFTLAVLTNDEVLEVDQDPLGKAATLVSENGDALVWSRPLEDGTVAVALFNRAGAKMEVGVKWSELGLSGSQPARDLWLRKDLGNFDGSFTAAVDPHGAVMVKIGQPVK